MCPSLSMHILHNPVGVQECTFKMVEYCPDENITAVDQEQEVVPPQETTMFSLFYIYFYFVSLLVFSLGESNVTGHACEHHYYSELIYICNLRLD